MKKTTHSQSPRKKNNGGDRGVLTRTIDLTLWLVLLVIVILAWIDGAFIHNTVQVINVCERGIGWENLDPGSWDVIQPNNQTNKTEITGKIEQQTSKQAGEKRNK